MTVLNQATQILSDLRGGDAGAAERLLPVVYEELRALAGSYFHNQQANHTLQPTALVHEAFVKMIDQTSMHWNDRAHFFAIAATAMRQILIDHARARKAAKRGGDWCRITIEHAAAPDSGMSELDVLALNDVLEKLAAIDPRQAKVVELRFFAGLSVEEAAVALGVSTRTVELDWKMAKAWLSRALAEQDAEA